MLLAVLVAVCISRRVACQKVVEMMMRKTSTPRATMSAAPRSLLVGRAILRQDAVARIGGSRPTLPVGRDIILSVGEESNEGDDSDG